MPPTKVVKAPIDAKADAQVCALGRDNVSWGDYSILFDADRVWLSQQAIGEAPTQKIELPRHVFDRFARWYTTGSTRRQK
jgi:hypothetical protein